MSSRCADDRRPARRVRQRRGRQLEVLGVVVVQDQQAAGRAGARLVLDLVLHALPARRDEADLSLGPGGVQQPGLAGDRARDRQDQEPLAAGQPHADPELLVRLLVDQHVLRRGRAEHVPPHPVRPPGVVDGDVEQRRAIQRPGRAVEGVRDLVGRRLPGHQVLDPEGEALAAGEIGGVREQPPVRAHRVRAHSEERPVTGQLVPVEQHLLALERRAVRAHRRPGVVRADGAAAEHRVLLALDRPGVVPPAALAGRHGQVGLLGPGLDLAEDGLAQARLAGGQRLGVGVLGLEERDRLRIVLVLQPGVLVDERVIVKGALVADPPGGRRSARGHEPGVY